MKELVTPKQVAKAIGVSESSLKRWCDRGLIPVMKTEGGHRRIPINGILGFIRDRGFAIVEPEVLGLPSASGQGQRTLSKARESLIQAFVDDNQDAAVRIAIDLFLGKHSMTDILDEVVGQAMASLGDKWACGDLEVYEERRAVEVTSRLLFEMRRLISNPSGDAPLAMGATVDGDPYTLAARMAEIVLRDVGYRSVSLGNGLPFETLYRAIENEAPTLFWLSVSAIRSESEFVEGMLELHAACERRNTRLAIGGVALTPEIRQKLRYHCFSDSMGQLHEFAAGLMSERSSDAAANGQSGQTESANRDSNDSSSSSDGE